MTKKQSKHQPKKSKQKNFSSAKIIRIVLCVIILIVGMLLDRFVWNKWNIHLVSRGRYHSGGLAIIISMLVIIALIIGLILKSIQYKQNKIDATTWKNYLYGTMLGIIILLIVTALVVWIAIATS